MNKPITQILKKAIDEDQANTLSKESINWFKRNSKDMENDIGVDFDEVTDRKNAYTINPVYGKLYHFKYSPKNKIKLPYYDIFPLTFIIRKNDSGFYGLNMHYLPHAYRAILMDNLYELLNNKDYDETTRLILTYRILNRSARLRFFRPCIKYYLYNYLKSPLMEIKIHEWNVALFLPTEKFRKADKNTVWQDSLEIIRKYKK